MGEGQYPFPRYKVLRVMQDLLQLPLWVSGFRMKFFACRVLCSEFLGPGSVVWDFAIWFEGVSEC